MVPGSKREQLPLLAFASLQLAGTVFIYRLARPRFGTGSARAGQGAQRRCAKPGASPRAETSSTGKERSSASGLTRTLCDAQPESPQRGRLVPCACKSLRTSDGQVFRDGQLLRLRAF